jgi:uncharacterized repeat protein (TIGR03803 family)
MSAIAKILAGLMLSLVALSPASAQSIQTFLFASGSVKNPAPLGASPSGGLIRQGGYLYGTTPSGANGTASPYPCGFSNGCGTVFRISLATGKLSPIYKFCSLANCVDGGHPVAGLVYRNDAYNGTTETGGTGAPGHAAGTVFKLTPPAKGATAWTETVLYSFSCALPNCADGNNPQSTLVFDKAGNLYGTTRGGAPEGGYGTVFELNPATGVLTTLYAFSGGTDGASPYAGVVFGKGGLLYGTTQTGGAYGNGTVFAVDPSTNALTTLYSFPTVSCPPNNCYPNGQFPVAGLTLGAGGTLYGTTPNGGAGGYGTLFALKPGKNGTWTQSVLYSFTAGSDGYDPAGPLAMDASGNLYGTTEYGGQVQYSQGTIFRFNPTSKQLATLFTFAGLPPTNCPGACNTFYPSGDQPVGALSYDALSGALYGTTMGGGSTTVDSCYSDFDSGCGTAFVLTP